MSANPVPAKMMATVWTGSMGTSASVWLGLKACSVKLTATNAYPTLVKMEEPA